MDSHNKWMDGGRKNNISTEIIGIKDTVVIQIQRFDEGSEEHINGSRQMRRRRKTHEAMDLEDRIVIEGAGGKRWTLEVVAVGLHKGEGANNGHYVAYVKRKDEWFLANDDEIKQVDFKEVKKQEDLMKSVYIVILRKIKEETAVEPDTENKSDVMSKELERKDSTTQEKEGPMHETKIDAMDRNGKPKPESILTRSERENTLFREGEDPEDKGNVDAVVHNHECKLDNVLKVSAREDSKVQVKNISEGESIDNNNNNYNNVENILVNDVEGKREKIDDPVQAQRIVEEEEQIDDPNTKRVEYGRETVLEEQAHDNNNEKKDPLEIKEDWIIRNAETEDCMFSSLCDSIGIQRSFKRDMKIYIRKKKEEET